MALSVVELYRRVLPKTNCGDCGFPTCLAFASMVVSEKLALNLCPHIDAETRAAAVRELEDQYADEKWTKRDPAGDALQWARDRAASMKIPDLQKRVGGKLVDSDEGPALELPYFTQTVLVKPRSIIGPNGDELTRWEQVFTYNHLAMGGIRKPTGNWKGLVELPNTVSKIKSMKNHVESPLIERFRGRTAALAGAGRAIGGEQLREADLEADTVLRFRPLPRIPVLLLFWDEEPEENYPAEVKLLFDETIVDHLDIESILFLSERIKDLLLENDEKLG